MNRKKRNMRWVTKTFLVLLLAFAFSGMMAGGWFSPNKLFAATYYMQASTASTIGVDSPCNLPAGAPSSYTGYPAKTVLGTAETGTGSRYYPAGFPTASQWYVIERLYAPVYSANGMDISNISASFAVRAANASDQIKIDLYDYDPAGAAGNKTLVATGTAKSMGTVGTSTQITWTAANFTISGTGRVARNHHLLVETSFFYGGTAGARFYFGIAGTTTSSNITVTETVVPNDSTPPTAGTVTVTPTSGTYTTAAPTITTTFTDAESAVTSCQYTTNNGTNWYAGTVSGAGPYTCSANPTGLTGSLTINMRATSTGGTGTATAVTRTVDATAPTDGVLTATNGDTQNNLSWTAASDINGIGSCTLVFATGATAPANCSSGTAVPGSPFASATLSTPHTGLTNGTQYSYRLCAADNLGNTSAGVTASATATANPFAISNCTGCHFKTGVADATSRNNPAGLFVGSHGAHAGSGAGQYAYACSKCHLSPATTGHANRILEMANPINANTGAKYGNKGNSWAYTDTPSAFGNCTNVYCHTNGTSVATTVIMGNISSPKWGQAINTCNKCHGTEGTRTAGAPWYPNYSNYSTGTPLNTGWTAPGNALHEDGATATYTAATQQPLVLSSLKVLVPSGKTITGISVAIKGSSATSRTLNIALTKTGNATAVGTAKTVALTTTNSWHVVNTAVNDLWGTTWTTADIIGAANTTFGVIVKDNAATTSNINIDAVRVSVHTGDAPKFNSHSAHIAKSYGCNKCHYATTTNGTSVTDTSVHSDGSYSVVAGSGAAFTFVNTTLTEPTCSNVSCHGNAVWGVSKFDCVSCHSVSILRSVGAAAGKYLGAVSTEFGLTYGHKKAGRGVVNADDCIVCHLEGNGTTHKPSTYHQNGTIDLRDPQGAGETIIKNFANADFAFARFSTSYVAGSRTSTKNSADIAQVVSLKFCIICHKKEGATNPTARSGAGTANSPWGASTGYALNANIGVTVANGTINVFSQMSSGNSSAHPVRGPRNKDYPTPARLSAPYNGFTRVGTSGTKTLGVMINCFDCHNTSALLTTRTRAAHGSSGTSMVRGTFYASGPTLCLACHTGYTSDTQHLAGSAMQTNGNGGEGMATVCQRCHGSADTLPARPIPAADYHGYNALVSGAIWPTGGGKPYGFIRNTTNFAGTGYHRPQRGIGELTTGSATCTGGTGCAGNGSARIYTPGGQY